MLMEPFLADQMNQILHDVEFRRVFGKIMAAYLPGETAAWLVKKGAHFERMRRVVVQKKVPPSRLTQPH